MNRRSLYRLLTCVTCLLMLGGTPLLAQNDAKVSARIDASQVLVGDAVHVFYEVQHDPAKSSIQWAYIPDSLGKLELLAKNKIDTVRKDGLVTYRQRLDITGFDSGAYYVPALEFSVIPRNGSPYSLKTDSLPLLVQTVAVDTTRDIKPIKGIIPVYNTWRDYIWYIAGGLVFIILATIAIVYFIRSKRAQKPVMDTRPKETLQEKAMKLLTELEAKQLWQKGQVKDYYVQLTDIVRGYIEVRFNTPALELTTDELIEKARYTKELMQVVPQLQEILPMADLAKFAKAQLTPMQHASAMEKAREIITLTRPVIIENPSTNANA